MTTEELTGNFLLLDQAIWHFAPADLVAEYDRRAALPKPQPPLRKKGASDGAAQLAHTAELIRHQDFVNEPWDEAKRLLFALLFYKRLEAWGIMTEPKKCIEFERIPSGMFDNPRMGWMQNVIKRLGRCYVSVVVKLPQPREAQNRTGTLAATTLGQSQEAGVDSPPSATPSTHPPLALAGKVLSKDEFVKRFYYWAYKKRALVVGHNLAFDLSRFATHVVEARDFYNGGVSIRMCRCGRPDDCANHPYIQIKHFGSLKQFIGFRGRSTPTGETEGFEGRFLDTATFGRALSGPGPASLYFMSRAFRSKWLKEEWPGPHGVDITPHYLDYVVNDVRSTFGTWCGERDVYRKHGLSKAPWHIYSGASIARGLFKDIGYPKFTEQHKDFPPELLGMILSGYYGGRSEDRIRLEPRECRLCDFKSQYPFVNHAMALDRFRLAEKIEIRKCKERIQELLRLSAEELLDFLHSRANWEQLCCFVQVKLDRNIVPIRASFDGDSVNIATTYVSSPYPTWYALPDILGSRLFDETRPIEILDAFALIPIREVQGLKPEWTFFGDEDYKLHPYQDKIFTRMIDMRADLKAQKKAAEKAFGIESQEYCELAAKEAHLKETANSGAYGVPVQIDVTKRDTKRSCLVYDGDGRRIPVEHKHVEKPGEYFAGPIGCLIPAGGRLLLAIAERLAKEKGLSYCFCDTDAMGFAKRYDMPSPVFWGLVDEIIAWFEKLNPYARGQLFELEDENRLKEKNEPLFFLGVSTKRYVLYNKLPDGTYRIRKFSAHGTGDLIPPENWRSSTPEPHKDVNELGGPRFMYDFWYHAIEFVEAKAEGRLSPNAEFLLPEEFSKHAAMMRVAVTTWVLYERFRDIPGIKPFSLFTLLSSFSRDIVNRRNYDASTRERYLALVGTAFYAPHAKDYAEVKAKSAEDDRFAIRRSDTREAVSIDHVTLAERLRHHLRKPESKFANPEGIGELERRHVIVTDRLFVGKESDEVLDELEQLGDGELTAQKAEPYLAGSVAPLLSGPHGAEIAMGANLSAERAEAIASGVEVRKKVRDRIVQAASKETDPSKMRNPLAGAEFDALEMTARTGIPKHRLKNLRLNKASPSVEERNKIVDAVQGGYDVEHALRHAHVTKPSEIQLKAMREYGGRERRAMIIARLREIDDDDDVASQMVRTNRTYPDACGVLRALKRGWKIKETDLKAVELAARNVERQRSSGCAAKRVEAQG
jgi:hypothetical protein